MLPNGSFRKLRVPYLGVLVIRILLYRVPCFGVLIVRILLYRVLDEDSLFEETPKIRPKPENPQALDPTPGACWVPELLIWGCRLGSELEIKITKEGLGFWG